MVSVGSTPVNIGRGPMLIQNIGPGHIYIGESNVDTGNGLHIHDDTCVAVWFCNNDFYVVSDATSDVRVLHYGIGLYQTHRSP